MTTGKLLVLVTGGVASGKTRFLSSLAKSTGRWWRICGFVSPGGPIGRGSSEPAASYDLAFVGEPGRLPWATRQHEGAGFDFCGTTRVEAVTRVRAQFEKGAEICFLDEIGREELEGRGFANLFRTALESSCRIVVAAVRKTALAEVTRAFGLETPLIVDLDAVSSATALRAVKRRTAASDSARIGTYAGIAGLIEVGLGSTLHAYRVPFKGHALAYLQNVLLVVFGKSLNGRGLVRISFISAMLKAFSPMGARFAPMMYIFVQGACFALPVRLLGWHLLSVLLGSLLMGWLTLGLSLGMDYLMFGKSIFDAFSGVVAWISDVLGIHAPSLFAVIAGVFLLKAVISLLLASGAYFGKLQPLVQRLSQKQAKRRKPVRAAHEAEAKPPAALKTAVHALFDLLRPRFMIAFLISALLLLFFAGLSAADFASVIVRGLCISYLGFVAMRRVNLQAVGGWLDRRMGLGLAESLPAALRVIQGSSGSPKDGSSQNAVPPDAARTP